MDSFWDASIILSNFWGSVQLRFRQKQTELAAVLAYEVKR